MLRRNVLPMRVVEPWISRIAGRASSHLVRGDRDPYRSTTNAQQLLRSLYLQLAVGRHPPADRADLILVTVDALRASNPFSLAR